jgi:hypothetical protein
MKLATPDVASPGRLRLKHLSSGAVGFKADTVQLQPGLSG